jgi:hypothetical protein
VTDKRFKRFVAACVVQILCGLGLALSVTAGQAWIGFLGFLGFLMAATGGAQIAFIVWSRRRNSN